MCQALPILANTVLFSLSAFYLRLLSQERLSNLPKAPEVSKCWVQPSQPSIWLWVDPA